MTAKTRRPPVTLRRAFTDIRRTYFPRWKTGVLWKVRVDPCLLDRHPKGREAFGGCLPWRKLIVFRCDYGWDSFVFRAVLIHEICHAWFGGHGKAWQRRMMRCAVRARAIGDTALAEALRDMVAVYKRARSGDRGRRGRR